MKVSLIQMNSNGNKNTNGKKAMQLLKKAILDAPDIICLSELFLSWGEDFENGSVTREEIKPYQEFAKENKVNIILGTVALKQENSNKTTNTCFVIDRDGFITSQYDKIYMYKVNRDNFKFDEHEDTIPGTKLGLARVDGVKIGIGICFDLRFPEYFRKLVMEGAQIIFLPAHFRKDTGEKAWDTLIPARAIENQTYFCACNQTGKSLCGKTKIVDYEGNIISSLEEEEGIISIDLNLENQEKFRKELPVLEQVNIKNYKE